MKILRDRDQLTVDEELVEICRRITSEGKTEDEWAEIESCDMFQSEHYCGGYDAIEQLFCFSYYSSSGKEWWFHFTLDEASHVVNGPLKYLDIYEPQNDNC